MKILGGYLQGRNFYMPKDIRPTPDRLRKSIFDTIGQDLSGLSFLDLFAGSGAVGLEAVSYRARHAVFVESNSLCAEVIHKNLEILKLTADESDAFCEVINSDCFFAIKQLHRKGERFNILFIDPPYRLDLAKKTLKTLEAYDILHPNCLVIVQHDKREILPEASGRILRVKEKKHGDSLLTIYKAK